MAGPPSPGPTRWLHEPVRSSLRRALGAGVPAPFVATAARWWQLETWLRLLTYVELRSELGRLWLTAFDSETLEQARQRRGVDPTDSADGGSLHAYLDLESLLEVVVARWHLFAPAVGLTEQVWSRRLEELRRIGGRVTQCRPVPLHVLGRVEQTLRDLEGGARRALLAYNRRHDLDPKLPDPVVMDWLRGGHRRSPVIEEARRKRIHFQLGYSLRPWAKYQVGTSVSGTCGALFELGAVLEEHYVPPAAYWRSSGVQASLSEVVHVVVPSPQLVRVTFPAVDNAGAVSAAIGRCFESVLDAARAVGTGGDSTYEEWDAKSNDLDSRLDVNGLLALMQEDAPFSVFSA